jgi:DNA-directed RNA polymerase specialized sigma24 family protein
MARQTSKLNQLNDSENATNDLSPDVHEPPPQMPELPGTSEPSLQDMNVSVLADQCMRQIERFQRGEPSNDQYGVELLRRAITQRNPLAWEAMEQRFHGLVLRWLRSHPYREEACRLDSEENYVAQAFARLWVATVSNQHVELKTVAAVLTYLRLCLNSVLLDTRRTYVRSREIPLPEPGEPGEPLSEERDEGREVWEAIRSMIPDEREQRVAYLLFHCNLKPREIAHFCPEELGEVEEIYRLRRNIFQRLLRNADYIRWRLDH